MAKKSTNSNFLQTLITFFIFKSLKIRIKQLESLLNVWLKLERSLNDLHLKFSKLSDNMNNNYSANFRQSYLNYLTDETKLTEQLNDIKLGISEYKKSLDSFKEQTIQLNSFQITSDSNSSSSFDHFSVHGSYLLKFDKFIKPNQPKSQ